MSSDLSAPCEVSVITIVRNAVKTLEECLESVASQKVPLQHIVVDGGSTDGTVELLKKWNRHPLEWMSEPDRGISHAFNKGIAQARGNIIGLLNADDRYEPGALQRGLDALSAVPGAGFCFGHCRHIEADGRQWLNLGDRSYADHLRYFMPDVNHPTMLVRRSAYNRVGGYDERWQLAMDYDWLIRAERAGEIGVLVDAEQARMAMGGVSDRNWRSAYAEARNIAISHGAPSLIAWADFSKRIVKGSVRRSLVALGARGLERHFRLARQRWILRQQNQHRGR